MEEADHDAQQSALTSASSSAIVWPERRVIAVPLSGLAAAVCDSQPIVHMRYEYVKKSELFMSESEKRH